MSDSSAPTTIQVESSDLGIVHVGRTVAFFFSPGSTLLQTVSGVIRSITQSIRSVGSEAPAHVTSLVLTTGQAYELKPQTVDMLLEAN